LITISILCGKVKTNTRKVYVAGNLLFGCKNERAVTLKKSYLNFDEALSVRDEIKEIKVASEV